MTFERTGTVTCAAHHLNASLSSCGDLRAQRGLSAFGFDRAEHSIGQDPGLGILFG